MDEWLRNDGDGVILNLHIQPGAKKTEVVGPHGDALKIRLAAPPVDGKANLALLAFLSEKIGTSKQNIVLISGTSSRSKRLRIRNATCKEIELSLTAKFPTD